MHDIARLAQACEPGQGFAVKKYIYIVFRGE